MKEQKNVKKTQRHNAKKIKGITLIALVITIVVLLILAAVSITAVFGNNGLLQMAKEAKDKTNNSVGTEQEGMKNVSGILGEYTNEGGGTSSKLKIADLMKKSKEEQVSTQNQDVEDAYGNPVTIPAGFRIVKNGESNVEYTYSGDGVPAVQDGIVIEDANATNNEENQFVWIPVGAIKNKGGEQTTITLGRYTFDIGSYQAPSYNGTGEEHLEQEADENTYTIPVTIESHYQELEDSQENNEQYVNAKAKNLKKFISKTKAKGGYYLARYEAVKGTDGKVKSIASTLDTATSNDQQINSGMVWNNITQLDASTKSQTMYEENSNFETDLVNSYAWDTAIVFIQTYSGENSSYSKQNSRNTETPGRTGERDETDIVCNIYDMASNLMEWSTETYTNTKCPCTPRGGYVEYANYYASHRDYNNTSNAFYSYSFRPVLYVTL